MMENRMNQIKFSNSSPDKMDSLKYQDPNTVVPYNKKDLPLEGVNSTNTV